MSSWGEEKLEKLRATVSEHGVQFVADAIPADRNTVYRLLHGQTLRPTKAVEAGLDRIIGEKPKEETHD